MSDDLRPVATGPWVETEADRVADVNADLRPDTPTVDVVIHYPNNLDARHREKVDMDLLVDGFRRAKEVFAAADVQLKLAAIRTGPIDPVYYMIRGSKPGADLPMLGQYSNMYIEVARHPKELTDEALHVFRSLIGHEENSDRTVHIVVLQGVFMDFFDPVVAGRVYQKQTIETSGLSFPGYMHGDEIPRNLRGVITITNLRRTKDSWKTIAHELGHKLLNVSHEHRDAGPAHEVQSDEGLMFYGEGTEIERGPEGRYHYERLHRSPFIYREGEDGTRQYNPDYEGAGFYYDQIYDGVSVEFDPD